MSELKDQTLRELSFRYFAEFRKSETINRNKRNLSELDIKEKCITSAIIQACRDELTQIKREEFLTEGKFPKKRTLLVFKFKHPK